MALNSGKILMRRGQEVNFDPNKMMPGEWAVSLDSKYVRMCFSPGVCVRMATYDAFEADMVQIQRILAECQTVEEAVQRIYEEIKDVAVDVERIETAAANALKSEQNALNSEDSASQSANIAVNKANEAAESANIASTKAEQATEGASIATQKASEAEESANNVRNMSEVSRSYAVGGTGTREGEDTDNAKYYNQQASDNADRAEAAAERASVVADVGVATIEKAGLVKPDGMTITVDEDGTIHSVGGGGGTSGTMNYNDLQNKPYINGVELSGDKNLLSLGIQPAGDYLTAETDPTVPQWAKSESKPTYTASEVGADAAGSADTAYENAKKYTDGKFATADERITNVAIIEEYKEEIPTYNGYSQTTSLNKFINYFDGFYVSGYTNKLGGFSSLSISKSKDGELWDSYFMQDLAGESSKITVTCSVVNGNVMLIGAKADNDSTGRIIKVTSVDGEWIAEVISIEYPVRGIAYGNGVYVAVCEKYASIYTSTDGTVFNEVKKVSGKTSPWNLTSIVYSKYGFLAVGYTSQKASETVTLTSQFYFTSVDGIEWSDYIERNEGQWYGRPLDAVAYYDDKFFIAGSGINYVLSAEAKDVFSNVHTSDTWQLGNVMPELYGDVVNKMLFANNVLFILGYNSNVSQGVVCASLNGISDWKMLSEIETTNAMIDAVYRNGNLFLLDAVGNIHNFSFEKIDNAINTHVQECLTNEIKEPFYFGYNGKQRGFYVDKRRRGKDFYPFLQNVPQIIEHGEITIASTSDAATFVAMEKNCVYMMPVLDITISNGTTRGYRTYIIYTSEDPSTKVGIITKSTLASGGTAQLSITDIKEVERVGVAIKPNAVAYKTIYSLIKLM